MYDFYYNYIKKTFSLKAKLLFAHRGSLPYEIETNDLCKNFHKDKDKFNFSEYPNNSKFLTWLTWLNCACPNRGFVHVMFMFFPHLFLFLAYFSAVATGSPVSFLIRPNHFSCGLPLYLFLSISSFNFLFADFHRSFCKRVQTKLNCLFRMILSIGFCYLACFLILVIEIRYCSLMFNIARRQFFSNRFNFLVSGSV